MGHSGRVNAWGGIGRGDKHGAHGVGSYAWGRGGRSGGGSRLGALRGVLAPDLGQRLGRPCGGKHSVGAPCLGPYAHIAQH